MGASEKEAVDWVRNAFREKVSREEITRKLLAQGYKLEYINSLIFRAKLPKRILVYSLIVLLILIPSFLAGYLFLNFNNQQELANPLQSYSDSTVNLSFNSMVLQNISITPEYVSYLLNLMGAWQLKTDLLNQEKPVINVQIGDKKFVSTVSSGKISTSLGESGSADILIVSTKDILIEAILSENPELVFKESFMNGGSSIQQVASEDVLFMKGYLKIYNSLK